MKFIYEILSLKKKKIIHAVNIDINSYNPFSRNMELKYYRYYENKISISHTRFCSFHSSPFSFAFFVPFGALNREQQETSVRQL